MDPRIKQYRDRAEDARRQARRAAVRQIQEQLLDMARQYDQLAADVERDVPHSA